jgi:hypothetical protein
MDIQAVQSRGSDELHFTGFAAGSKLPANHPGRKADRALLADLTVVVGHDVDGVGVDADHASDFNVDPGLLAPWPHDLRHTFSTWLEDAGIPARVIDELMGHHRSRHGELDGGSRIGARYRHTTDAMAVRVVEAIQERLTIALRVAQDAQAERQGTTRVF